LDLLDTAREEILALEETETQSTTEMLRIFNSVQSLINYNRSSVIMDQARADRDAVTGRRETALPVLELKLKECRGTTP
jgi:hypothetical protein